VRFFTIITIILIEIMKTLHLIRLGIERNEGLLTATNDKLEELAAKLDSVNGNIFDISERFDAPGIAKRKTDKRAQGIKALLDRLESEAGQSARS
jgi:sulfur transfer protein SufE